MRKKPKKEKNDGCVVFFNKRRNTWSAQYKEYNVLTGKKTSY